jgi:hypothetical protein
VASATSLVAVAISSATVGCRRPQYMQKGASSTMLRPHWTQSTIAA